MNKGLKKKILELRQKGESYNSIVEKLKCSKSLVSYHCKNEKINGGSSDKIDDVTIGEIEKFYTAHTITETAQKFDISRSTVLKYAPRKRIMLSIEERRVRSYSNVKVHRQKMKAKGVEYKGGKCQNCGYEKSIWAMDFHHKSKNEKTFNISRYSCLSWDRIRIELDKCILLCSNCHRELHHLEFENFNEYVSMMERLIEKDNKS
jgi:hypothetical protein